jgi:hypothetical protein
MYRRQYFILTSLNAEDINKLQEIAGQLAAILIHSFCIWEFLPSHSERSWPFTPLDVVPKHRRPIQ